MPGEATIDNLQIVVGARSSDAADQIDKLSVALLDLKSATKGGAGLNSLKSQLDKLNQTLSSIKFDNFDKISGAVEALKKLSDIGNIKISSTLASQIKAIGAATTALDGNAIENITRMATAVGTLRNIGDIKISSTIAKQIGAISAATRAINSTDVSDFANKTTQLKEALMPLTELGKSSFGSMIKSLGQVDEIAEKLSKTGNLDAFANAVQDVAKAMEPLVDQAAKVYVSLKWLPGVVNAVVSGNNQLARSFGKTATQVNVFGTSLNSLGLRQAFKDVYNLARSAANLLSDWVTESNSYVESLNLFTVAMGEYASEAQEFAETVSDVVGIDPAVWMKNQGVFMTLATGFGVVTDKAALMSKNLTQLGYDLSSFFNIGVEDAMQKLQSGISGELEPLRRLGYDLSQARLQQIAYANGITESVSAMTQAEKAQLRYVAIMTQVTTAQGDMSRTLEAPANQLRIFQASVTQLARALGNILIPAINRILPYVIAFTNVVRYAAQELANFLGFELPDVDYSGIGNLAASGTEAEDALEGAATAAKELKDATLGIDELNVISPNQNAVGGFDNVLDPDDFDLDLPEYDFLGDAVNDLIKDIEKDLIPLMDDVLEFALGIAGALAAWELSTGFKNDLTGAQSLLSSLMIGAGITLLLDAIEDIRVGEGLTWENLLEGAGGGILVGAGLGSMLAKALGLTWSAGMLRGGIVGLGVGLLVSSIQSKVSEGLTWQNVLTGAGGLIVGGTGLGALLANKLGLTWAGGALRGGTIGLVAALVTSGVELVLDNIKNIEIGEYDTTSLKSILQSELGALLTGIGLVIAAGPVAGYAIPVLAALAIDITGIVTNKEQVAGYFSGIGKIFSGYFEGDIPGAFGGFDEAMSNFLNSDILYVKAIKSLVGEDAFGNAQQYLESGGSSFGALTSAVQSIQEGGDNPFLISFHQAMKAWETFPDWLETNALNPAIKKFTDTWLESGIPEWMSTNIFTPIQNLATESNNWYKTEWSTFWEDLKKYLDDPVQWVDQNMITPAKEHVVGLFNYISLNWNTWWTEFKGVLRNLPQWQLENVINPTIELFEEARKAVNDFFLRMFQAFMESMVAPVNTVLEVIETVLNSVRNVINTTIIENINKLVTVANELGANIPALNSLEEVSFERWSIPIEWDVPSTPAEVMYYDPVLSSQSSDSRTTTDPLGLGGFEMIKIEGNATYDPLRLGGFETIKIEDDVAHDPLGLGGFETLQIESYGPELPDDVKLASTELMDVNMGINDLNTKMSDSLTNDMTVFEESLKNVNVNADSIVDAIDVLSNNTATGFRSVLSSISTNATYIVSAMPSLAFSSMATVPAYASGGFPATGELFLARENGIPEMVGSIGGQTAVANNNQIIDGITQGVMVAEQSQNALLREQNELLTQILAKTGTYLNGKQVTNLVEQTQRQRGVNIMSGGVAAH